ncbi:MAG TPA: glycosyltransferase family 4 protein [Chthoniobacteraceae bacterium]|jgi:glycosyltransferase involved in cell wall biosynthesis|nr:glycosyltransferase family 4 protein [Chthoniobacteraceae bacterium]
MASEPPTRVAFAIETPIFFGGGVSVLVRELIECLSPRFALVLVSPDESETIRASPLAALLSAHIPWARPMAGGGADELAARIVAAGVQVAHFHMAGNFSWGNRTPWTSPFPRLRRAGVRCLTTSHLVVSPGHGLLAPATPWWKRQVKYFFAWVGKMRALANQEREIAVSQHDLRLLRRWYFPLRKKFIRIYHSRLDESAAPTGPRRPVILHVGHRAQRKGQLDLVRAFSMIAERRPAWELMLVGPVIEPEYEAEIVALVRAAGLEKRVHLLGQRDDAGELMQTAAVYVQPSLQEALGLALQEALFAGCACVGTRVGGIPELIEHDRTGLLTAPGDAAGMAAALERLLDAPAERERLGAAGAASIRDRGMTAERMASEYAALYEKLLSPRR